jgi:thioesterase domain-containing protein
MNPATLQAFLHEYIPLSRALAVEVVEVGLERVQLAAPLAPNRNHRQTAFGGSVASLAILAGWSWLHVRLAGTSPLPDIVIQQQQVEYLAAVDDVFTAICAAPPDAAWRKFLRALEQRARGRLELTAEVRCRERLVARFSGQYVAVTRKW